MGEQGEGIWRRVLALVKRLKDKNGVANDSGYLTKTSIC